MKQATNPFAPVPLWRKRLPGYAAMGVATIALAVGLTTLQSARTTVAGTLLPVSEADAAAYGISAVYQLDDGSYRVEGSQKGFQSDVQAARPALCPSWIGMPLPAQHRLHTWICKEELQWLKVMAGQARSCAST